LRRSPSTTPRRRCSTACPRQPRPMCTRSARRCTSCSRASRRSSREPALSDFGVAWLADAQDPATRTQALTTYHEVLDGSDASGTSDVYSLGSTLYQLLTARPAYERRPGEGLAADIRVRGR